MDQTVLDWLLEDINPEVRLKTLKEYEHLPDNDEKVIACKKDLIGSKVYERGLKKLGKKTGTSMMQFLALPNGGDNE